VMINAPFKKPTRLGDVCHGGVVVAFEFKEFDRLFEYLFF